MAKPSAQPRDHAAGISVGGATRVTRGAEGAQQMTLRAGHPGVRSGRRRSRRAGPRASTEARCCMREASSSAWVGCSWVPSPALMTCGVDPLADLLRRRREALCRMTRASTPIAATVSTVSRSDSPLDDREPLARDVDDVGREPLAGDLEGERVRVESSKKRLTTVRPRSAGSFLTSRCCDRGHLLGEVEDLA